MAAPTSASLDLHADRSAYVRQGVGVTLPLAILATAGRFVSRRMQKMKLNASDYMCIASFVGVIAFAGLTLESIGYGFGRRVKSLSPETIETFLKIFFAAELFYVYCITSIKLTILLLYTSVFPGKGFAVAARIVGAVCCAWAIACSLGAIFTCTPIRGFWDSSVHSKCLDTSKFFIGNAAPNIATDIAILCLPTRELWRLHLSLRHKMIVAGFFLAGGFVVIASTVRLGLIVHQDLSDPTFGLVTVFTWSNIEINTALLSACLPTLRPLFLKFWPSFLVDKVSRKTVDTPTGKRYSKDVFTFRGKQDNSGDEFHRLKDISSSNIHPGTLSREYDPESAVPAFPENSFAASNRLSAA